MGKTKRLDRMSDFCVKPAGNTLLIAHDVIAFVYILNQSAPFMYYQDFSKEGFRIYGVYRWPIADGLGTT